MRMTVNTDLDRAVLGSYLIGLEIESEADIIGSKAGLWPQ